MSQRDPRYHSHGLILTINGGSSSLKCSLFQVGPPLTRVLSCLVDRIGFPDTKLTLTEVASGISERRTSQAAHHRDCVDPLIAWLEQKVALTDLLAIGHRVVHGGHHYSEPQRLTPAVMGELHRLSPYDPESSACRDRADRDLWPAVSDSPASRMLRHQH